MNVTASLTVDRFSELGPATAMYDRYCELIQHSSNVGQAKVIGKSDDFVYCLFLFIKRCSELILCSTVNAKCLFMVQETQPWI
jgi:hypothetical protein